MSESRIQVELETTKTPAGNALVKHPETIFAPSWQRITIAKISAGQPRAYADSVYSSEICFEGGTKSTVVGYDLPHGTKPSEDKVKNIARLLVHSFEDVPSDWAAARLKECIEIDSGDGYSIWRVTIVEPFTD